MKKILSLFAICAMAVTSASASTDPDYVEIGGLRWAKMNLGATTVADSPETSFGDYYAWGATEPWYSNISWSGTTPTVTWKSGYTDGYSENHVPTVAGSTLSATEDIATITYPGWRMPSADECKALADACNTGSDKYTFTTVTSTEDIPTTKGIYFINARDATYKVAGMLFIDSKGASVFFPAAGDIYQTNLSKSTYLGTGGWCWSSSLIDDDKAYALGFLTYPEIFAYVSPQKTYPRYEGNPVRPVQDIPTSTAVTINETDEIYLYPFEDDSKTYDITLNRTMKAGRWNTLMLPFDMTSDEIKSNFGESAKVMKMTDIKNNVVSFESATNIEYEKAYIVEPATDITKIEVKDKTATEAEAVMNQVMGKYIIQGLCFQNTFDKDTYEAHPMYVLSNNNFYQVDSDITVMGYRWEIIDNSGVKARTLTLSLDGVTTGINEVEGLNGSNSLNGLNGKFVENGRVVIVKNNQKFNAAGQLVR